ncbi:hypothetical protein BH18THE2_BH18THE2_14330 [soil metagenome]
MQISHNFRILSPEHDHTTTFLRFHCIFREGHLAGSQRKFGCALAVNLYHYLAVVMEAMVVNHLRLEEIR